MSSFSGAGDAQKPDGKLPVDITSLLEIFYNKVSESWEGKLHPKNYNDHLHLSRHKDKTKSVLSPRYCIKKLCKYILENYSKICIKIPPDVKNVTALCNSKLRLILGLGKL